MRLHPRPIALTTSALVLTLGVALAPTASAGAPSAAVVPAASDSVRAHPSNKAIARRALTRVERAVDGRGAGTRDLSSAYRDLFVHRSALRGDEQNRATNLLARPTTPPDDPNDPRDIYYGPDADLHSRCSITYCLHWVEDGEHAATPAFADEVFTTLRRVAVQYVAAGFKLPLFDEGQEGSRKTDFYLGDIGAAGALGFCRSDEDEPTIGSAYAAYCGFDNDFAGFGYDGHEADLMHVTVAHEYFHAVQYAYDAEDAGWIYESTAAWIEDEVFDEVDDNAYFLNYGQMGDPDGYPYAGPTFPLDELDEFGGFNTYGNWGFWRYLTEQHRESRAGIPTLVRDFWQALDTTGRPNPTTARQALDRVLASRRSSTADEYVGFAAANQRPADFYREGYLYPTAPDGYAPVTLTADSSEATRSVTLDHLTSASGTITPAGDSHVLQVRVDGDPGAYSQVAVVVVGTDGRVATRWVRLNRRGQGNGVVPFSSDRVAFVEVTVANGGEADARPVTLSFRSLGSARHR